MIWIFLATATYLGNVSVTEDLKAFDRVAIIERLKKAYAPVSVKLDGTWVVTTASGTETWTYTPQGWKCPQSTLNCADWWPASFKWFGAGKSWLSVGGPNGRSSFDFQGQSRQGAERSTAAVSEETEETETIRFEGKRNAVEIWDWSFPFDSNAKVGISLRDYLIERVQTSALVESLEWGNRAGTKGLSLERLLLDKNGEKILLNRK